MQGIRGSPHSLAADSHHHAGQAAAEAKGHVNLTAHDDQTFAQSRRSDKDASHQNRGNVFPGQEIGLDHGGYHTDEQNRNQDTDFRIQQDLYQES